MWRRQPNGSHERSIPKRSSAWTPDHPGPWVVARYLDGRTLKGQTADFLPTRPTFHVIPSSQIGTSIQVVEVKIADLKAVFFVKDLAGDAAYNEAKAFAPEVRAMGRKVQVEFADGETIVGTTQGYY